MKRYDAEYDEEDGPYMEDSATGDYIKYEDHLKAMEEQRDKCKVCAQDKQSQQEALIKEALHYIDGDKHLDFLNKVGINYQVPEGKKVVCVFDINIEDK